MKLCSKCGETKGLAEFARNARARDGLQWYCKGCQRTIRARQYAIHRDKELARNAEYRAANIARIAAGQAVNRLRRYGLTKDKFSAILAAQGGACAVCASPEPGGRHGSWHVDHDHDCCDWQASL
ncbi:MAG TPA: endonuclease domain-containing protein, partial [Pedococcus sp.]|nr:endonuclease domain-containing protein [Pedococcus sp.]